MTRFVCVCVCVCGCVSVVVQAGLIEESFEEAIAESFDELQDLADLANEEEAQNVVEDLLGDVSAASRLSGARRAAPAASATPSGDLEQRLQGLVSGCGGFFAARVASTHSQWGAFIFYLKLSFGFQTKE